MASRSFDRTLTAGFCGILRHVAFTKSDERHIPAVPQLTSETDPATRGSLSHGITDRGLDGMSAVGDGGSLNDLRISIPLVARLSASALAVFKTCAQNRRDLRQPLASARLGHVFATESHSHPPLPAVRYEGYIPAFASGDLDRCRAWVGLAVTSSAGPIRLLLERPGPRCSFRVPTRVPRGGRASGRVPSRTPWAGHGPGHGG